MGVFCLFGVFVFVVCLFVVVFFFSFFGLWWVFVCFLFGLLSFGNYILRRVYPVTCLSVTCLIVSLVPCSAGAVFRDEMPIKQNHGITLIGRDPQYH